MLNNMNVIKIYKITKLYYRILIFLETIRFSQKLIK